MILALEVAGAVVVVLLLGAGVLRFRKLRRDETRERVKPLDRRLVAPPPSPYAPSKGFRLLDSSGEPLNRPPVERPRLDTERPYVFTDAPADAEEYATSRLRHNDDWFLSRSSHRSTLSILLRRVGVVVLVVLVIVVVATYYVNYHANPPKGSATNSSTTLGTTSTTSPSVTTTSIPFPSSFLASSTNGDDAVYRVPAAKYRVTVTGSLGATWAVYNMGPTNTLEWQGTVAKGRDELLTMTGDARITIGSPSNAAVSFDGRPVIFPTPPPSTLILVILAAKTGSSS